jgi:hypothetical protein
VEECDVTNQVRSSVAARVLMGAMGAVGAMGLLADAALAQDWSNSGGNSSRNGLTGATGPSAAQSAWSIADPTIIAWSVVTMGDSLFTVREWGFPGTTPNAGDEIVARRVSDGSLLWRRSLPYGGSNTAEWIAWVAGARDGRVYASRSTASGPSGAAGSPRPITAMDAVTGDTVWNSAATTVCGPYDGVVFAPNGDLVVGDRLNVTRIRATDGGTVWRVSRVGSVSGNCGAALSPTGVFIADAAVGGHVVKKLDLDTGALLYQSPVMPGFTVQNSPFVSPDGTTVLLHRTQNSGPVDLLYAFSDTGSALVPRWSRPVRWTTSHEAGMAADGGVYTFLAGNEFVKLSADTGDVVASAGFLAPPTSTGNLSPRTVVDGAGRVYVHNGWAGSPSTSGRLWAFTADLDPIFEIQASNPNIGGPGLAADGTLLLADLTGVRAWRTASPCLGDLNGSDAVDGADLGELLVSWGTDGLPAGADLDGDGVVGGADLGALLAAWGSCP